MSSWTYISAVIDVDTYIEDKDTHYIVTKRLRKAPKITGSEGNAEVFVNIPSGHNCSTMEGEFQTRAVITVVGHLRDRTKARTTRQWEAFLKYISDKGGCRFAVRNYACQIED